jgi:proteasome lid subunit RPN8/RPN11
MVELTSKQGSGLQLPFQLWELMRMAVEEKAPEEACGLLAGKGHSILGVLPITNKLHSPVRYQMDPLEQLQAFRRIEDDGQELVGIYHSHPNGPDVPSATDIAEAFYPDAIYVIWYRLSNEWRCRGFMIWKNFVTEVGIQLMDV